MKLQLAAVSAVVLTVGALLAPRTAPPPVVAPSQERAAPLLGERVQSRGTSRPFDGVQDVAMRVRGWGVSIVSPATAAPTVSDFSSSRAIVPADGFGVYLTDSQVLTRAAALDGRSSTQLMRPGHEIVDATLVAFDPPTGQVLLQVAPSGAAPPTVATASPPPGSLVVATGWADGRDIAVPVS